MLIDKIKYFFRDRRLDIYCPHCSSCGETGCCKPTICINHPKGLYCESNLRELKTEYHVLQRFRVWVYDNRHKFKETYNMLSQIEDEEYYELQEYYNSLPKKLTITEKIKEKWKTLLESLKKQKKKSNLKLPID
jgi:hypothetical protein